jgi:hypothetical protein
MTFLALNITLHEPVPFSFLRAECLRVLYALLETVWVAMMIMSDFRWVMAYSWFEL